MLLGKKTHLFAPFYTQNASFYHDRLGTKHRESTQKRDWRFLTDAEACLSSPAVLALARLYAILREGRVAGDSNGGADTDLALLALSETHGHYQWEGSAIDPARFPNLYNRELFVWLPVRVNATRYAAVYYVMTQNITDDLPPEAYSLSIAAPAAPAATPATASAGVDDAGAGGAAGGGAGATAPRAPPAVQCFDPILNEPCPVTLAFEHLAHHHHHYHHHHHHHQQQQQQQHHQQHQQQPHGTALRVGVEAMDYPRVLTFDLAL